MKQNYCFKKNRGVIMIMFAVLATFIMGLVAFSVDFGMVRVARADLQVATDAGAKAGAAKLPAEDNAESAAIQYVENHLVFNKTKPTNITVEFGQWDSVNHELVSTPDGENSYAIKVTAQYTGNYTFAKIFGVSQYTITTESIATNIPRDIMLSVDISESMNDDSQLSLFTKVPGGIATTRDELWRIYQELGSPTYGNMVWEPKFIATSSPQAIKSQLGLDNVIYPYPSGSWDDFIAYVKNDKAVKDAGFQKKYGYLTLVNYWMEMQPKYTQTPVLWKTSAEPLETAKDLVDYIVEHLNGIDRLGLITFNNTDGNAGLEQPLTANKILVSNILRGDIAANIPGRQAGHYHKFTNVAAGMKSSRDQLDEFGRPYVKKLIIVIGDGKSTWNSSGENASAARRDAIQQAGFSADDKVTVSSISVGADANLDLFQEIADITGGVHLNIPSLSGIESNKEALDDFFEEIASRPVLVK